MLLRSELNAHIIMPSLGFVFIGFIFPFGNVGATQTYYTEISSSGGSDLNGKMMQQTPRISKLFHQCSMKDSCNYMIEDRANGITTHYNSENELPRNKTGLRIWKKIYVGELSGKFIWVYLLKYL